MADISKITLLNGSTYNLKDASVPSWAKASSKPSYTANEVGAIPTTQKGAASGVAELDSNGKVPSTQLPSYVDDVLEYSAKSSFPTTGETGKIYVDISTNLTYRWSGTAYVEISPSLALGETSSTAYRGDRGKTAYDHASAKGSAYSSGLYKITTNSEGHVTAATAVAKADITALGIPGSDTNTTYSLTQDSSDGHKITLTPSSGTAQTITIPDNNTDTKVTSAANHYTPSRDTSADKSASASGATAAWSIDVVKGVTVQTDGKGHVTGVAVTSGKIPGNPNTDTHRPVQVNGTQALGNNTTALNLKAGSNVTITDGGSGAITIAATDTNTWRGIQDNLTSSSNTTESLSAKQGYLLANGSARDDTKVSKSGDTMTGDLIVSSGSYKIGSKNDDYGIMPFANNWNSLGASNLYWYRSYVMNYYGTTSHITNWDSNNNIGTAASSSAASVKGLVNFYNECAAGGTQTKTALQASANSNITLTLPNTTGTLALSNHTHTTSIATSTGTNQLTLAANTKYAITAGGASYVFTTPPDTNTWRPVSDSVSSTSSSDAASSKAVKTAYDLAASKTANTGTVTSVATGVGLAGGTITGSGTLKAKLRSETALTIDSASATTTSGRVYPVAVDKTGYLAVNVPWANDNTTYSAGTGLSLSGTTFSNSGVTGVKGNSESSYRTGNVNITSANIGLGNVENKSSATIRGELTKANVTTALGYTPPTTDTNTWRPIGKTSSDAAAGNTVITDSTARTISAGTSSAYSVTNLTTDHVVAAWRFSGGYTDNNPPGDITVTTANGSYTIQASNLLASGITMQPIFIKP